MSKPSQITVSTKELASLLETFCQAHIMCLTVACKYYNPALRSRCSFAETTYLREGTCRYYEPGKMTDRTDLGDGDYLKFIDQLRAHRKTEPSDHRDSTEEDRRDK